ncbi:hypothetical protein [uncultured Ruminococcus sp.]|uniref:hypothetical protein n=1 Tax=uncultured Ruminococcus sp. TaxID=165186 RepID=UPI0025DAFC24|nr:hypothetical protein [uncultured Ruminococcus sp.]
MAVKKEQITESENTTVEIPKEQLEQLMSGYEDMKNQIAVLTKQAAENDSLRSSKENKLEEERKLLELVKKANAEGEELVDLHIDRGALRSNKNAEVSINGVQTIIPKGKTIQVKRCLKEIIDNSEKQSDIAMGLQKERNTEYKTAEAQGVFNA